MKKSIAKRIKITSTGKVLRRRMGIGHNGTRRSKNQKFRKQNPESFYKGDMKLIAKDFTRA